MPSNPVNSLQYNIKRIDDKRVGSLRLTGICYSNKVFDSQLAEQVLRRMGYGEAIDELDRLLMEKG